MTSNEMVATLMRMLDGDPYQVLCDAEVHRGWELVKPGTVEWLIADDWADVVVSRKGKYVRLVAVISKIPAVGSFSRLIDGILKAGLVPLIVCPTGDMRQILARWQWRMQVTGDDFNSREDIYRPTTEWMKARLSRGR